jgi:hypothetical protein
VTTVKEQEEKMRKAYFEQVAAEQARDKAKMEKL